MQTSKLSKTELFERVSIPQALAAMGIPTIISQLINLIYNMVDAFFIGRTGNSYMMAATTITLTLTMLHRAIAIVAAVGGGSLIARLMGQKRDEEGRKVSAYAVRGAILLGLSYAAVVGLFMSPILRFLGASENTLGFAEQYATFVIVVGTTPTILALTLAHLLRNTGHSSQASLGLSMGGILNMALDPLFMFVILPKGQEVLGAALATLISNIFGVSYLLLAYRKASARAPLTLRLGQAPGPAPAPDPPLPRLPHRVGHGRDLPRGGAPLRRGEREHLQSTSNQGPPARRRGQADDQRRVPLRRARPRHVPHRPRPDARPERARAVLPRLRQRLPRPSALRGHALVPVAGPGAHGPQRRRELPDRLRRRVRVRRKADGQCACHSKRDQQFGVSHWGTSINSFF